MNKTQELEKLREEMFNDKSLPLRKGATNLVFGDGNPEAKILCVGEGPGYWENEKGLPFVGNAGKLLDQLLQSINLSREKSVYITNVVHHRPPENRDPLPEEIEAYRPHLDKIIEIIKPKMIVTLGRFSMGKFLPAAKITSVHGKTHIVNWKGREIVVIPMYHPAAALRSTEIMRQIQKDFQKLPVILEEVNKPEINQMKLI
ncbi:uracil-DNA glycosylase [Candidatus Woesebacteria bacterium]|nr:uracil-DNA glycosylase [Candidatus Woesebacteria bacterium]